jgi:hypothetical protein
MTKIEKPEGYEIPADIEDGQTFEELTTYRVEGEYLVPTMIAGVEIPKEDESSEDESTSEEDMAASDMEAENPMKGLGARVMGMA